MKNFFGALLLISGLVGCANSPEPRIDFVEVTGKSRPLVEVKSSLVNVMQQYGYRLVRDTDLILDFDDSTAVSPVIGLFVTCNSCPPPRYKMQVVVTVTKLETRARARVIIVSNPGTGLQREIDSYYKPETAARLRQQLAEAIKS
jgi:hypothetical protein